MVAIASIDHAYRSKSLAVGFSLIIGHNRDRPTTKLPGKPNGHLAESAASPDEDRITGIHDVGRASQLSVDGHPNQQVGSVRKLDAINKNKRDR